MSEELTPFTASTTESGTGTTAPVTGMTMLDAMEYIELPKPEAFKPKFDRIPEPFMGLTTDNVKFVEEYIMNGRNGTRAYMSIYPDAGYNTAKVNASKLLRQANTKGWLKLREEELTEEFRIRKYEVIKDIRRIQNDSRIKEDGYEELKAIDILNRMAGFYNHDQTKIDTGAVVINIVIPSAITESNE